MLTNDNRLSRTDALQAAANLSLSTCTLQKWSNQLHPTGR